MIALDLSAAVATITLDRPDARNAISMAGWRDLADAFARVAASDAAALVLRSAVPGHFSAGADLADLARLTADADARTTFRATMRAAIEALAVLPMPSVALVEGGCHGAAVALALAADLIVASADARFAVPPARLGIGYPREDVARLVARTGRGAAARLLFTATAIDAAEAWRIGLVDTIGDCAPVLDAIVANDVAALRLLKRTLADPGDPTLDTAFDDCFGGAAFAAGLARFHRRPRS